MSKKSNKNNIALFLVIIGLLTSFFTWWSKRSKNKTESKKQQQELNLKESWTIVELIPLEVGFMAIIRNDFDNTVVKKTYLSNKEAMSSKVGEKFLKNNVENDPKVK